MVTSFVQCSTCDSVPPVISSPTRGGVVVPSVLDHHRTGRRMGRAFLANHSFSIRSSSLPSHWSSLSPSSWSIHSCRSSDCHPRTVPLNSSRSYGASDLGCSVILTPLISDIRKVPISWKSKLRLSSTSRVPSTHSPDRSTSRPHTEVSQLRHPLCLTQNQHAPNVQSGQIAVSRPPQSIHQLFGSLKVSSAPVRCSPKSKS